MRSTITRSPSARATGTRSGPSRKSKVQPKLRVKNEPPTLEEAMVAAACITEEPAQQLEIAAELMGLTLDPTTAKALSAARPRGNVVDISVRGRTQRTVVVEKKRTIRTPAAPVTTTPRAFAGQLRLGRI